MMTIISEACLYTPHVMISKIDTPVYVDAIVLKVKCREREREREQNRITALIASTVKAQARKDFPRATLQDEPSSSSSSSYSSDLQSPRTQQHYCIPFHPWLDSHGAERIDPFASTCYQKYQTKFNQLSHVILSEFDRRQTPTHIPLILDPLRSSTSSYKSSKLLSFTWA